MAAIKTVHHVFQSCRVDHESHCRRPDQGHHAERPLSVADLASHADALRSWGRDVWRALRASGWEAMVDLDYAATQCLRIASWSQQQH